LGCIEYSSIHLEGFDPEEFADWKYASRAEDNDDQGKNEGFM
jgi:hypothetical protein